MAKNESSCGAFNYTQACEKGENGVSSVSLGQLHRLTQMLAVN
jgi:hypothetical protein